MFMKKVLQEMLAVVSILMMAVQILNSFYNYVSVFFSLLNVYILKASLIDSLHWLCFLLSQLFLYFFYFKHFFTWGFIRLFTLLLMWKGKVDLFLLTAWIISRHRGLAPSKEPTDELIFFSRTTFNLEYRPLDNVTPDSCWIFAEGFFYACLSIGLKWDQD